MKGFSASNLKHMRRFAQEWPDLSIGQQPVTQLPWGNNLVLLFKLDNAEDRLWYARRAVEKGWNRNVVDDVLRHETDGKTIGLLLVREKNDTVVRYSLEGFENPLGVAEWQEGLEGLEGALPAGLEDSLPTIEEIECEIDASFPTVEEE